MDKVNYYKVLELTENASLDEIQRSYREMALKYHPDRNKNPNTTEKFIEISEAYETLSREKKGNTELTFARLLIKPGKVSITTTTNEFSFVTVSQEDALFFGKLTTSQDKQFSVVFSDGYSDFKKWINGKVLFVEKNILFWIKEFERPWNAAVSDTGRVVLIHTINRDYSRISSHS